jgi:endogenous inhibitor of DNA gyrase (YacG/DUF329 family)
MQYHQKPMYHIVPSGDYLHVVCAKCGEQCEMDYKGRDPSLVKIEVKCPKCGSSGDWKLHRAGMGFPYNAEFKPKARRGNKPDSQVGVYETLDPDTL